MPPFHRCAAVHAINAGNAGSAAPAWLLLEMPSVLQAARFRTSRVPTRADGTQCSARTALCAGMHSKQRSRPDWPLGSFIERRSAASVAAPQSPQRSYQVVRARGAAIGPLGQLHCGHTAGKRSLGSITLSQRLYLVVRTRGVAHLQIDERTICATTGHQCHLTCTTRPQPRS